MRYLALLPTVLLLATPALAADAPKPAEPVGTVVIPAEKVPALLDLIWACGVNKQACLQAIHDLQDAAVKPPPTPPPAK